MQARDTTWTIYDSDNILSYFIAYRLKFILNIDIFSIPKCGYVPGYHSHGHKPFMSGVLVNCVSHDHVLDKLH